MATRVPLSTDDLLSSSTNKEDDDESYYSKIPILKRRLRATNNNSDATTKKDPICVIVVGMAGSGKTTLMAQLQKSLSLRENDDDVSVIDFLCGAVPRLIYCCVRMMCCASNLLMAVE